jgi:hypothetical protein
MVVLAVIDGLSMKNVRSARRLSWSSANCCYSRAWPNPMPAIIPQKAEKYSMIENFACNIIGNITCGRYRTRATRN